MTIENNIIPNETEHAINMYSMPLFNDDFVDYEIEDDSNDCRNNLVTSCVKILLTTLLMLLTTLCFFIIIFSMITIITFINNV